ncbi:putative transmembrane protein, partial [Rhizoctonia solani 123E]
MKNVFALLAGLVLLAPAVLASPVAFPGGEGGHSGLPV